MSSLTATAQTGQQIMDRVLDAQRVESSAMDIEMTLVPPLSFTKGLPVLRVETSGSKSPAQYGTLLFDLAEDPNQEAPLDDPDIEQRMIDHMVRLMRECDAPDEQYTRIGIQR